MKKLLFLLTLIFLVFALASCDLSFDFLNPEAPGNSEDPTCEHAYVELERIEPMPLRDGAIKSRCSLCQEEKIDAIPMTRKLKILVIGNSFVDNSLHYLWGICNSAGMQDAVFGNANIGGASLATHAASIANNINNYNYIKYEKDGQGVTTSNMRLEDIIADEDWDYIAIQQLGHLEGVPTSFSQLETILDFVSEKAPGIDIYWYMTWAYQQNSTHSGFAMHDNDQMTMYNAIVSTVQEKILTNPRIKGVVPCGTAMQNLRTSCIGDNTTRDGYHAKAGISKYTLSLTWYAYFTGGSIDDVFWYPQLKDLMTEVLVYSDVAAEAVKNALATPFEITQSTYTEPSA